MKITHVCQFLGVGGLEQVLYTLIQEQISLGHDVDLIVYDHDRRWVEKFRNLGITVHTDYLKKDGYDFQLLGYLKRKTQNREIIHTHDLNPMLYLGVIRIFDFLKLKKLLLIHTTHGMEHLETHPKTKFYEIFLGLMAKKIIAVSPKFKSYYEKQILTCKNKVSVINNGTTISKTIEATPKQSNKEAVCHEFNFSPLKKLGIYVARIVPLKGQDELINFFKDRDEQLLLVGPSGNDEFYNNCLSKLPKNIRMTGNRSDISHLLMASDFYVSASLHEGLPISVIEAGALGVPCLLKDIPGHATFNQEAECVLLYNDHQSFNLQLEKLFLKNEILKSNFHQLILSKYSAQKMALEYLDIYKAVYVK